MKKEIQMKLRNVIKSVKRQSNKSLNENYYSNQLSQLDLNSSELIGIQLVQGQVKTNWFTLNRQSIQAIKDFLEKLEDGISEKRT